MAMSSQIVSSTSIDLLITILRILPPTKKNFSPWSSSHNNLIIPFTHSPPSLTFFSPTSFDTPKLFRQSFGFLHKFLDPSSFPFHPTPTVSRHCQLFSINSAPYLLIILSRQFFLDPSVHSSKCPAGHATPCSS